MTEEAKEVNIKHITPISFEEVKSCIAGYSIIILKLPVLGKQCISAEYINFLSYVEKTISKTDLLIVVGEEQDLIESYTLLQENLRFHYWISVLRDDFQISQGSTSLPRSHFGILILSKSRKKPQTNKTLVSYSYCPNCNKTTKDYGGKKHLFHHFGTTISDVWRDEAFSFSGSLVPLYKRVTDIFGKDGRGILAVDLQNAPILDGKPIKSTELCLVEPENELLEEGQKGLLLNGDVLEELRKIPSCSVDYIFTDPPYNIQKTYNQYKDNLADTEYYKWCTEWLSELIRVLKPGRTISILNIPFWSVKLARYLLDSGLEYQNWITWDAISLPTEYIMPAHYPIICFSKGPSRKLPGLGVDTRITSLITDYCLRPTCIKQRNLKEIVDQEPITDLWHDIHRIKHNSKRQDHPTQLPSKLLKRLISIFTNENEIVLDCFNATGTTTISASETSRRYIGIEISKKYHSIAQNRHNQLEKGIGDYLLIPDASKEKNNGLIRLDNTKYEVPKKILQLEAKRITNLLGRRPTKEELMRYSDYKIEYFEKYFIHWGEVFAATRASGMNDSKDENK